MPLATKMSFYNSDFNTKTLDNDDKFKRVKSDKWAGSSAW